MLNILKWYLAFWLFIFGCFGIGKWAQETGDHVAAAFSYSLGGGVLGLAIMVVVMRGVLRHDREKEDKETP